jgi:hypothetical protein
MVEERVECCLLISVAATKSMSTAEGNNFLVIESHAVEDLEMHELIFSQQSTINILASLRWSAPWEASGRRPSGVTCCSKPSILPGLQGILGPAISYIRNFLTND